MKPHVVGSLVLAFTVACSHHAPRPQPISGHAQSAIPTPAPPPTVEAPDDDVTVTHSDCDLLGQNCRRTVVTSTSVTILDHIGFVNATATLDNKSGPMLDAIAATLFGNPSILVVGVHAFGADAIPGAQQAIAERRARTIVAELVKRGVDARRLRALGDARPPGPPRRDNSPQFEILQRAP